MNEVSINREAKLSEHFTLGGVDKDQLSYGGREYPVTRTH